MQVIARVVDLSHHNYNDLGGKFDWKKVRQAGIWGVIYKATEGNDYQDDTYPDARRQVKEAGLLFGAYHFFRPGNVGRQVDNFLNWAEPDSDLLLVLDHEDEGCSVEDVKEFLRLVEAQTGQRPALYSGHVIKEQLGSRKDEYLGSTRLWMCQYGSDPEVPPCWDSMWLWQYTDGDVGPTPHAIPGIGNCDINSFQGTQAQLEATWAESEGPPMPGPTPPTPPQPEGIPLWLGVMRAITGLTATPGSADNPKILDMAHGIGQRWQEQKTYPANYKHDDTPWCGLTVGYCMTMADIEPVFGPTDTDRWMWALAWSEWPQSFHLDAPQQGCVVVTEREGGGHVTLFEEWEGRKLRCRGGNQSDMVNVTSIDPSTVVAYVWPMERAPSINIPTLTGPEVQWLQSSLNLLGAKPPLDVDGEIGELTRTATAKFQKANDLPASGFATKKTVEEMLTQLALWNEDRY